MANYQHGIPPLVAQPQTCRKAAEAQPKSESEPLGGDDHLRFMAESLDAAHTTRLKAGLGWRYESDNWGNSGRITPASQPVYETRAYVQRV